MVTRIRTSAACPQRTQRAAAIHLVDTEIEPVGMIGDLRTETGTAIHIGKIIGSYHT